MCKERIDDEEIDLECLKLETMDPVPLLIQYDVKDFFTASQWEEFLIYEAKASVIGKMIENVQKQIKNFNKDMEFQTVSLKTGEFIPLIKKSVMSLSDLNDLNNKLMGKHKTFESKKNYMLSQANLLMEKVQKDDHDLRKNIILSNQEKQIRNNLKIQEYKNILLSQVGKLRIVVLNELQEIVDDLKKSLKLDDSKE